MNHLQAPRLKKRDRQERIIGELRADPFMRISTLAERFGVTTETIRRDVDELSEQGLVSRTYGGAALHPMGVEPGLNERHQQHVEERQRIASHAVALVERGEVLMVDAGSTTLLFARRLAAESRGNTVITNSVQLALSLAANPAIRVVMCPGDFDLEENAVAGPETVAFLQRFRADKAIIGASGLTAEGPSEVRSPFAWVKRTMLGRARRRLLLADSSKFDQPMLEVVCPLDTLTDIVVDQPPAGELRRVLDLAELRLHVAP